ncbi:MAG TPA: hypothetical protein VJ868_05295 [Actinomycetota bacterium]|nr:hypothetical protein [Actinomycetota bacterium]
MGTTSSSAWAGRISSAGNGGNDAVAGDAGNDKVSGSAGLDLLYGGVGGDLLTGGNGFDAILANAGNDRLFGQGGQDELFGQPGRDLINGGPNPFDIAAYLFANGVNANLATRRATGDGVDRLRSIEILEGSRGNDTFIGTCRRQLLLGLPGRRRLPGAGWIRPGLVLPFSEPDRRQHRDGHRHGTGIGHADRHRGRRRVRPA